MAVNRYNPKGSLGYSSIFSRPDDAPQDRVQKGLRESEKSLRTLNSKPGNTPDLAKWLELAIECVRAADQSISNARSGVEASPVVPQGAPTKSGPA